MMANKLWVGTDTGNEGDWGTAANWSPSGVPIAADNIRIPAGSASISGTLDQSAVAIGDFVVEAGYTGTIGTSTADLQIDPNLFEFAGTGTAYIDLGAAAIDVLVKNTATATTGNRGLYLIGSAIDELVIQKGKVGIAWRLGETATITTARISHAGSITSDASVWFGDGTTLTTLVQRGGNNTLYCAATTATVSAGTLTTGDSGTITTVNADGGNIYPGSTGTITTLNLDGANVDFSRNLLARTVTTLVLVGSGSLKYDPGVLTVTNITQPSDPVTISTRKL